MVKIKLAYCPTRRDVFSRDEAMKFNEKIRSNAIKRTAVDVFFLHIYIIGTKDLYPHRFH